MRKQRQIAGLHTSLLVSMMIGALAACLVAPPAFAQRGLGQGKNRQEKPKKAPPAGGHPGKALRGQGQGVPPQWMERLRLMSPEEQERFLSNNERFRNLPPEKQAKIRERLRDWNNLSPEQRRTLRERANIWEKIPPEQRQRVRQELLPKWRQLPPERRQEIRRRLAALNGLSEEERAAKLRDPQFLRGLNPEEQSLLNELSNLRVSPSPGEPQ